MKKRTLSILLTTAMIAMVLVGCTNSTASKSSEGEINEYWITYNSPEYWGLLSENIGTEVD